MGLDLKNISPEGRKKIAKKNIELVRCIINDTTNLNGLLEKLAEAEECIRVYPEAAEDLNIIYNLERYLYFLAFNQDIPTPHNCPYPTALALFVELEAQLSEQEKMQQPSKTSEELSAYIANDEEALNAKVIMISLYHQLFWSVLVEQFQEQHAKVKSASSPAEWEKEIECAINILKSRLVMSTNEQGELVYDVEKESSKTKIISMFQELKETVVAHMVPGNLALNTATVEHLHDQCKRIAIMQLDLSECTHTGNPETFMQPVDLARSKWMRSAAENLWQEIESQGLSIPLNDLRRKEAELARYSSYLLADDKQAYQLIDIKRRRFKLNKHLREISLSEALLKQEWTYATAAKLSDYYAIYLDECEDLLALERVHTPDQYLHYLKEFAKSYSNYISFLRQWYEAAKNNPDSLPEGVQTVAHIHLTLGKALTLSKQKCRQKVSECEQRYAHEESASVEPTILPYLYLLVLNYYELTMFAKDDENADHYLIRMEEFGNKFLKIYDQSDRFKNEFKEFTEEVEYYLQKIHVAPSLGLEFARVKRLYENALSNNHYRLVIELAEEYMVLAELLGKKAPADIKDPAIIYKEMGDSAVGLREEEAAIRYFKLAIALGSVGQHVYDELIRLLKSKLATNTNRHWEGYLNREIASYEYQLARWGKEKEHAQVDLQPAAPDASESVNNHDNEQTNSTINRSPSISSDTVGLEDIATLIKYYEEKVANEGSARLRLQLAGMYMSVDRLKEARELCLNVMSSSDATTNEKAEAQEHIGAIELIELPSSASLQTTSSKRSAQSMGFFTQRSPFTRFPFQDIATEAGEKRARGPNVNGNNGTS